MRRHRIIPRGALTPKGTKVKVPKIKRLDLTFEDLRRLGGRQLYHSGQDTYYCVDGRHVIFTAQGFFPDGPCDCKPAASDEPKP